jgi:hypothetical protein
VASALHLQPHKTLCCCTAYCMPGAAACLRCCGASVRGSDSCLTCSDCSCSNAGGGTRSRQPQRVARPVGPDNHMQSELCRCDHRIPGAKGRGGGFLPPSRDVTSTPSVAPAAGLFVSAPSPGPPLQLASSLGLACGARTTTASAPPTGTAMGRAAKASVDGAEHSWWAHAATRITGAIQHLRLAPLARQTRTAMARALRHGCCLALLQLPPNEPPWRSKGPSFRRTPCDAISPQWPRSGYAVELRSRIEATQSPRCLLSKNAYE